MVISPYEKSLSETIESYKAYLIRQNHSRHSVACYLSDFTSYTDWLASRHLPVTARITSEQLADYCDHLKIDKGVAQVTVNRKLASLRKWTAYITSLNEPNQHMAGCQRLTRDDIAELDDRLENLIADSMIRYPKRWLTHLRDVCLVRFIMYAQLPVDEVVAIKAAADFDAMLRVNPALGSLPARAVEVLKTWLMHRPNQTDNPYLWISPEHPADHAVSERSAFRVIAAVGHRIGVPLSPAILRQIQTTQGDCDDHQ